MKQAKIGMRDLQVYSFFKYAMGIALSLLSLPKVKINRDA